MIQHFALYTGNPHIMTLNECSALWTTAGLTSSRGLLNCGLRVAGHRLHCGLRVAGHTQIAGCGPQIAGCGSRATLRLRAAGHRLLILLVAKLQVAKMSCCKLLNCRLRFARLFRLGGCQLLDLLGYNMGYRLPNE